MTDLSSKRSVAIVGRPNVGKSAIFNRLAGRRIAIVHDESGVTRDRVSTEAIWGGQRLEIIDTGGLSMLDGRAACDALAEETRKQAEVAMEDAAVILFVTDVTAGVAPLDREVARLLHKSGRPVLILANKADNDAVEKGTGVFTALGFPVFPVSALHGRGFDQLQERVLGLLPAVAAEDRPAALRVAVVGRPNAGKSSYINRLLRSDRVIVSEVPGTTRDSIEIPFQVGAGPQARHYVLIDTAGMRKVGKIHNTVERFSLMRTEKSIEDADVVVLVLDAKEGPRDQDKKIAAKIIEARKGCVVLVNKWDLLAGYTQREYTAAFQRVVPFLNFAPLVYVSSQSGLNIRRSIEVIDHVAGQITMRLPTGTLNRLLHQAVERVQPPHVQGKRMRLYYVTQVDGPPIRIRLFVNDTHRVTDAYRQYLIRNIREAYGLEGAPVLLDFRSSHKEKS